jgi:hypothetical protein
MKRLKCFQGILAGSAFLLTTNAFAADKGTLHISSPAKLAGGELAAGDYTVRWDDAGTDIHLRIMQGKNVLVSAPAKVVPLDSIALSDGVVLDVDADGSRRVLRMCFEGKKFALEVESGSGGTHVDSNS